MSGARARPTDSGRRSMDPDRSIFEDCYAALHRLAAVVGPVESDPSDLVQEALVRALRRGPLSTLDDPLAYLRRSVVNLAANERRRLGRHRRATRRLGAEVAEAPSYATDVEDLRRLSPRDRATLWLADVEGWPFEQVAEITGGTAQAARARASRARRRLRAHVDEENRA